MDSNTHSIAWGDRLAALEAEVDRLAAQHLDGLSDVALAEGVCGCGGWRTGWTATAWPGWPRWMPGGPPGPRRASRSAPPPPGCEPGCA